MDATERKIAGRANAYKSWAITDDRAARTAPARAALLAKFETEVDPEGVLAPHERARRAEYARKAYFTALALKSAQSRRRTSGTRADEELRAQIRAAAAELDDIA